MSNSGSGYEIVIPEPVARRFEEIVPHGLTDDVIEAIEELAADPSQGQRVFNDPRGPMVYPLKVERLPLVFSFVVGYCFAPGEEKIIILSVVPTEDDDEED